MHPLSSHQECVDAFNSLISGSNSTSTIQPQSKPQSLLVPRVEGIISAFSIDSINEREYFSITVKSVEFDQDFLQLHYDLSIPLLWTKSSISTISSWSVKHNSVPNQLKSIPPCICFLKIGNPIRLSNIILSRTENISVTTSDNNEKEILDLFTSNIWISQSSLILVDTSPYSYNLFHDPPVLLIQSQITDCNNLSMWLNQCRLAEQNKTHSNHLYLVETFSPLQYYPVPLAHLQLFTRKQKAHIIAQVIEKKTNQNKSFRFLIQDYQKAKPLGLVSYENLNLQLNQWYLFTNVETYDYLNKSDSIAADNVISNTPDILFTHNSTFTLLDPSKNDSYNGYAYWNIHKVGFIETVLSKPMRFSTRFYLSPSWLSSCVNSSQQQEIQEIHLSSLANVISSLNIQKKGLKLTSSSQETFIPLKKHLITVLCQIGLVQIIPSNSNGTTFLKCSRYSECPPLANAPSNGICPTCKSARLFLPFTFKFVLYDIPSSKKQPSCKIIASLDESNSLLFFRSHIFPGKSVSQLYEILHRLVHPFAYFRICLDVSKCNQLSSSHIFPINSTCLDQRFVSGILSESLEKDIE